MVLEDGGTDQTKWKRGLVEREIEMILKRFDASIEWLMERITMREEEIETIKRMVGLKLARGNR